MGATQPLFDFRVEDKIGIFRILDRIEVYEAEKIRKAVRDRVERERLSGLVFTLAEVPYIDSSGVGAFVNLQYDIGRSVSIRLCEVADSVRDVLTFTNLVSRFAIDDTEPEAIDRLRTG